jgi:dihydropteroate synthase
MAERIVDCAGKRLDLTRPQVMGILNLTPDSFSDGGSFYSLADAVAKGVELAAQGAAIIDVGGESTRPGAQPVPLAEELARVVPVIEGLRDRLSVPISIDSSKPEVMRAAVAAGAGLINDVMALRTPGALEAAGELQVPVCLMHMQGEPRTMQHAPRYDDVVSEVIGFLSARISECVRAGIARERILVDPGFGFGKNLEHNLRLLKHLSAFLALGVPVVVGMSRKSMIGAALNVPVGERLVGGVTLAAIAVWQGASVVRAHDVGPTVQAVRMCEAVRDVE